MRTMFYFCLLVAAAGFHGLEAMGPPPRPSGGPPRPSGRPPGPPGPPGNKGTTADYGWTDDDYDENEGWVSCGCHDAPSCRKCGTQQHLCNGDCSWSYGGCYRKGPRPTNPGPRPTRPPHPPTGETPVSMPSRPPPTWETPVSIPGSRPPPTYETPVHIGSSTPGPGGNGTSTEGITAAPEGSTQTFAPLPSGHESEIKIRQTWCQEPNGFDRRAIVRQPTTSTPGERVPVVVCLHGSGGQATFAQWKELWNKNLIVAPEGYDRRWNIFKEASKAPDVEFIEALIAKVGEEYPNADMDNVILVGSSNGAGLIHRLLVESNPRPFHKVFPMVSTLTTNHYNNGKFWKNSPRGLDSADCENDNVFDIEVTPASPGPEIYTIQGTNDGAVPYTGGPGVAGNTFLAAQDVLFLYAKTLFGYSGSQLSDSAGEETSVQDVLKYSYLNGKVNHYKVIGGTHGDTSRNIWPIIKAIINP